MKNLLLIAAVFASSFASADTYGLGLGGGVFYPSSSLVRDLFGSSWVSYGISPASAESSVGGKIAYDLQIFARRVEPRLRQKFARSGPIRRGPNWPGLHRFSNFWRY